MAASIGTAPPGGSSEDGRRPERNGRIPIQLLLSSSSDGGESAPGHHRPLTQEYPRERHSGASVGSSHGSSIPVSVIVNPSHSDGYTTGPREPIRVEQANGHRTSSGRQLFELEDVAWTSADFTRRPRAPRPSYSEEQKFFIMFARIMQDRSWPEIEDHFADVFGTRTKGGLTSVYYRVRKDWGLSEVLKSGPGSFTTDCREVERRAQNFSAEFLTQIGYLSRP